MSECRGRDHRASAEQPLRGTGFSGSGSASTRVRATGGPRHETQFNFVLHVFRFARTPEELWLLLGTPLAQVRAAERLGVNQAKVSGVLSGKAAVSVEQLVRFITRLGFDAGITVTKAASRRRTGRVVVTRPGE